MSLKYDEDVSVESHEEIAQDPTHHPTDEVSILMTKLMRDACTKFEEAGKELNVAITNVSNNDDRDDDDDDDDDDDNDKKKAQLLKCAQRCYYKYAQVLHILDYFVVKLGEEPTNCEEWDSVIATYDNKIIEIHTMVKSFLGDNYDVTYTLPTRTPKESIKLIADTQQDIVSMLNKAKGDDTLYSRASDGSMVLNEEWKDSMQEICDRYRSAVDSTIHFFGEND